MVNLTSYNKVYGNRPKAEQAFHILHRMRLSQLDISSILKPKVVSQFERWFAIGEQDEFASKVYFILREMYTVIKSNTEYLTTQLDLLADVPQF